MTQQNATVIEPRAQARSLAMSTAAWYKRAVYQFVQSRGCEVGSGAAEGRSARGRRATLRQ